MKREKPLSLRVRAKVKTDPRILCSIYSSLDFTRYAALFARTVNAFGLMGNRYIKIYSILCNLLHLLVSLVGFLWYKFFTSDESTGAELVWSFGLPQVVYCFGYH